MNENRLTDYLHHIEQAATGERLTGWLSAFSPAKNYRKNGALPARPVMLRVTPVMLRAVAASRKSPWNDLNPDILDSATDARNNGVRLPCPFRYAVALAKARCRRDKLRQAQLPFGRLSFDKLSYRRLRQAQLPKIKGLAPEQAGSRNRRSETTARTRSGSRNADPAQE